MSVIKLSTSGQEQAKPCPASRDVTDQLGCQKMDNGINSQLIVRTYSFQNNTQNMCANLKIVTDNMKKPYLLASLACPLDLT